MSAPQNPAPTPNQTPAPNAGQVPVNNIASPTPPLQTRVPTPTAPTPVAPVGTPDPATAPTNKTPASVSPATPPTPAPSNVKTEAQGSDDLKKAKSVYLNARLNKMFGRLRRHVSFFIVCGVFLYANVWMFANAWQQEKAGENENWFNEGLFLVVMVILLITFYYRLYRKSDVYQAALLKKEAAEKAAREARLLLEEEQKKQAFMGLIKDFQSASNYDQKGATMAKLLTVGLESNLLRQQSIDLLCGLNQWMTGYEGFMSTQNLIVWRLKSSLFEQSERFQVDSATQDLSIKSVNIIEAIVKRHLIDFSSGRTKTTLDLSHKTIPTLTLTAQTIPSGSLKFDHSNLWQSNFAETKIEGISFAGSNMQASSFWRAQWQNVDVAEANIEFSKLRTNLQGLQNLTAKQLFSTKEWDLCYLSPEQQTQFFSDTEAMPEDASMLWNSSEPRRRKLYFHLLRQQADALD